MELELIIQNGADAVEAEKLGADRLELVSAIQEGGLTPSYGTIKQVLSSVSVPVYVMVRPHSNRFIYDEKDIEIMLEDIDQIVNLGGNRIVIGALNDDGTINENLLKQVIEKHPKIIITFHRAFDEVKDQIAAYETLVKYKNVKYILTSGGAENCQRGQEQLKRLVEMSRELDGPSIMPGAGLDTENIKSIHETVKADFYHFGKAVRIDESFAKSFDPDQIKKIKDILK